jgi:D-alanyl-lipoteichoic acid acyltransferase DltB (MBOAT superfamily)
MPYAAANIAEFWRRWHISLSSWLRDYVYFSFPGLRGTLMPYVALFLTMVIGGYWHGPTWNFVIWGALHGFALAVCRAWQTWRGNKKSTHPIATLAATLLTLQFVCFCWIFFRATTLDNALDILAQIASLTPGYGNLTAPILLIVAIAIMGHYAPKKWLDASESLFTRVPFAAQAAALALLALGIKYVAATGSTPFVYGQF